MSYVLQFVSSHGDTAWLIEPEAIEMKKTHSDPWVRSTIHATVFETIEDARAACDALLSARVFEAPELNSNLSNRLLNCVVVQLVDGKLPNNDSVKLFCKIVK